MSVHHYILATAGHVDHGKSALVKALTGTDPDRLPEEKARGITIDLGFACLDLPDEHERLYRVGIVDVPGHEDFVKNMVAGVGSIDLALLIVAADDGWMPQTEEHLQILEYLGVRRAVVALTKIDLAPELEEDLVRSLESELEGTNLAGSKIVPTSVQTGRGIEELKNVLRLLLRQTPAPADYGKPRLPVDRVFMLRGIGTVATGTLIGGSLEKGWNVVVQPSRSSAKIRTLQTHQSEVPLSQPGTRTALNLPDLESGASSGPAIQRGDVVTLPSLGKPHDTLDVLLEKSPRLENSQSRAAKPLKDGALVRLHLGTANIPVRIKLLDGNQLPPGSKFLGQLRAEQPVFAFSGDRFILRDWPEQTTLAGGIVLDPDASRKKFHHEQRREYLEARARDPHDPGAFVKSQLARDGFAQVDQLLIKSRFSRPEIESAAAGLVSGGTAISAGNLLLHASRWKDLLQSAAALVDAEHQRNPDSPGLPLNTLRSFLEKKAAFPSLVNLALADLCRSGYEQVGTTIRHSRHIPALPSHLDEAGKKLRAVLQAKRFDPPSRKELAPDGRSQQALRFLLQTGEAIELGTEVVISAQAFSELKELTVQWIRKHGPSTVSQIRQAAGASRRIVVPFLERLDRDGLTRRQGDLRMLRS